MEEWGREDTVRERFDGLANSVQLERRTLAWSARLATAVRGAHGTPLASTGWRPRSIWTPTTTPGWSRSSSRSFVAGPAADGAFSVEFEYLLIVARRRG